MSIVVHARQYDTLDLLCWRYFGVTAAVTELAIELNPGIARHGEILPEGLAVALPDEAPERRIDRVNLWD
jgi:phage tail protein X